MSCLIQRRAASFPLVRTIVMTTLLGTAWLAGPFAAAYAEDAQPQPMQNMSKTMSQKAGVPAAAHKMDKAETIEARIEKLHVRLKITPDQEAQWNGVAQAMHENAVVMEKLMAEKRAQNPLNMTALDDLTTYQEFAQAHVDGLKNLTSAFSSLYGAMPDDQKKVADQVFQSFGREAGHHHMADKAN